MELRFSKYRKGETVPAGAIYQCGSCGRLRTHKENEKFFACRACKSHEWYSTKNPVHFVSKNLNTEYERARSFSFKVSEYIADIAGNVFFVYFHIVWFSLWVLINTGEGIFGIRQFDPYPYLFLVLVVSLEAIFLATFILIAQNIQTKRSEIRGDIEYNVNMKTEKEVAKILAILSEVHADKLKAKKPKKR